MTNVININEPYIKYDVDKNVHTFKVSMANLSEVRNIAIKIIVSNLLYLTILYASLLI